MKPDHHAERNPAWDAGFTAGWQGELYDTNPYRNGADRETWFSGWMVGAEEKLKWPKEQGNG